MKTKAQRSKGSKNVNDKRVNGLMTSNSRNDVNTIQEVLPKPTSPANQHSAEQITVIGSTTGNPEDDASGSVGKRKSGVRGKTTLPELTQQAAGVKIHIEWSPSGVPNNIVSSKLASYCGIIARNAAYVPIQLKSKENVEGSFYCISKDDKQHLYDLVCDHFDLGEPTEQKEKYILSSIGKKYSEHLSHLKKSYKPDKTFEEQLMERPAGMDVKDWEYLLAKWSSDKHMAISEKNSINRSCAIICHSGGSQTQERAFADETRKNGAPPGKYHFWKKNHVDKRTGAPMDPKTAALIAKVEEEKAKADAARAAGDDTVIVCIDAIFEKYMPKKRKVRSSADAQIEQLSRRFEEAEAARKEAEAAREEAEAAREEAMLKAEVDRQATKREISLLKNEMKKYHTMLSAWQTAVCPRPYVDEDAETEGGTEDET